MGKRWAVVIGLAAVGAVAFGVQPAVAEKTLYSGSFLGPEQESDGGVGFKLESKRKRGKVRPLAVLKFRYTFLIVTCQDSEGPRKLRSTAASGIPRLPLKNREFSDTTTFDNLTYEVRGRIPRKGPATGTIRVSGSYPLPDTGPVVCDSTVPWTANIYKGYASG